MSRDLTPRELYSLEQYNIKNHSHSLWDFMRTAKWTIKDETFPLYSEESIAIRKQYPTLGRLYSEFDKLYAFLSNVEGGLELLQRHDNELMVYIETGTGDKESALIKWFEGELDCNFHYRERNDKLFLTSVKEEVFNVYRSVPTKEKCFWFPLTDDKCISVWYASDKYDGDQLQMKLEQRGEDGSMGPHCQVLICESYGTANLTYEAIQDTLEEIYWDAGVKDVQPHELRKLTDTVMSVFDLGKEPLDVKIHKAKSSVDVLDNSKTHIREQEVPR